MPFPELSAVLSINQGFISHISPLHPAHPALLAVAQQSYSNSYAFQITVTLETLVFQMFHFVLVPVQLLWLHCFGQVAYDHKSLILRLPAVSTWKLLVKILALLDKTNVTL